MKLSLMMVVVAMALGATPALSIEDPREDFNAEIVVLLCSPHGCREKHVLGSYTTEIYGTVDYQIVLQRKMSMRGCKNFLASPMGFVQVQNHIARQIFSNETIRKVYCDFSDIHEI